METIELELQMKADVSDALLTGELVAFNCTYDKEIILAVVKNSLDYGTSSKLGASFAKTRTQAGQNYCIFYTVKFAIVTPLTLKQRI